MHVRSEPTLHVFAGPSLDSDVPPGAILRPPASRGDLDALTIGAGDVVALIDGTLVYDHAPSPSEVWRLMERGARVHGAASLGALRAVELRNVGMSGHGWVYRSVLGGAVRADDELVASLDPRTGEAMTLFVVNLRYACEAMDLTDELRNAGRSAVDALAGVPFTARSRRTWADLARRAGLPLSIAEGMLEPSYNVKAIDATTLIRHLDTRDPAAEAAAVPSVAPLRGAPEPHAELAAELGITRITTTTHLDVVGLPTASATRPGTRDVIWVYSGKGATEQQARNVAVFECLERVSALWPADYEASTRIATGEQLVAEGELVWRPEEFTEPTRPDTPAIPWTTATKPHGGNVWVPADLVYAGARPDGLSAGHPFRVRTSNGLGAGSTLEQAQLHALLELVERDVVSRVELSASHLGNLFIRAVSRAFDLNDSWVDDAYQDDVRAAVSVEIESLSPNLARLAAAFTGAGLELVVKVLPNDLDVPTAAVAVAEEITPMRFLATAGFASRPTVEAAVEAAMLELAQTRATDLQGAREDRHDREKERWERLPRAHWLLTAADPQPLETAAVVFGPLHDDPLKDLIDRLANVGLDRVAFSRFSSPPGTYVVRAIVPGIETWHATGGESTLGPRSKELGSSVQPPLGV